MIKYIWKARKSSFLDPLQNEIRMMRLTSFRINTSYLAKVQTVNGILTLWTRNFFAKMTKKDQPKHTFVRTQIFLVKISIRNYVYSETLLKLFHNG